MAVRIVVDYAVLDRAKAAWRTQAERLDAATRRIAHVTGGSLAPAVAAEVRRLADTWHSELGRLASIAQDDADAFVDVKAGYLVTDRAQAERIRSLLPWGQRHDPIVGR